MGRPSMVELSSLDVHALARELRALEDAHIDKVYQLGPDEFLLKLRHPEAGGTYLVLRPGGYAARPTQPPETPEQPTALAQALRRWLTGARLRRVDQHEFDRVLRFQLDRRGEPLELVLELFGKGNLILAGPDGRIVWALRSETFAHRTIKRGELLRFPPARVNPITLVRSEFERLAEGSEKDVVRFAALDLALGGDLAEELVHRSGADKARRVSELEPDALDRLWNALRELLEAPVEPAVAETVRGPQVATLPFVAPLFHDMERERTPTVSEAVLRVAQLEADRAAPEPDRERARLERQVGHQERGVRDLGLEAERWERRGHLLFAHYVDAARVLQKAKATLEASDWSELARRLRAGSTEPEAWLASVSRIEAKAGRIVILLEGEEVPVDPFESVEHNATLLYDEAKRVRAKLENAKAALADARERLRGRAERPRATPRDRDAPKAPAKRFWFESNRWFYSSEGFLVVAGRDARANERLVRRHLSPGDRFVHADIHGAPSVVLKCEGREPGPATLREACQFGATNSKAFAQFATGDAYWVHPEQVSKTAESGESLPKGGFMVRGTRHYETKLPLVADLGLLRLDARGRPGGTDAPHRRLVAAPPSAIAPYTSRTVRVERGPLKASDAAKRIAPLFGVTVDEVVAALPPGTVQVAHVPEARA